MVATVVSGMQPVIACQKRQSRLTTAAATGQSRNMWLMVCAWVGPSNKQKGSMPARAWLCHFNLGKPPPHHTSHAVCATTKPCAAPLGLRRAGQVVKLEHLPCQALKLEQARHHLGLDLCRHLHQPHPPLGWGQGAGKHPWEQGSRGRRSRQPSRVLGVFMSQGHCSIAVAVVLCRSHIVTELPANLL